MKLVVEHDWSGSERAFRRGLELSPGSDFMWAAYGLLLSTLERFDEDVHAYAADTSLRNFHVKIGADMLSARRLGIILTASSGTPLVQYDGFGDYD